MYNCLKKIQNGIIKCIDFFYPPFKRFFSVDIFRYGVCGVSNMLFDWVLYFFVFHFVVRKQIVDLGFVAFTPHIGTMLITFPITFLSGFLLSKYISFRGSSLVGKVQFVRYALVVAGCVVINYVCLKIFVEVCGFYPTPSKMLTTVFTVLFSYFSQKNFTFKS